MISPVLPVISRLTMANTSDGGKGVPPDPPNANPNIDNLFTIPPAAHRAQNGQFLTEIDQDMTKYSTTCPPSRYHQLTVYNSKNLPQDH